MVIVKKIYVMNYMGKIVYFFSIKNSKLIAKFPVCEKPTILRIHKSKFLFWFKNAV